MPILGNSKFLPVFLYQKGLNKFVMLIFGHSEFIPVFFGQIVRKNLEWPFLAILNLYQSFWVKLSEKFQNGHFWSFQSYTSLFGKSCQKKMWNGHFWLFQIYTSQFVIFGHSKFIPVFLGKIVRQNSEWPFLAILNLYQSFWEELL